MPLIESGVCSKPLVKAWVMQGTCISFGLCERSSVEHNLVHLAFSDVK